MYQLKKTGGGISGVGELLSMFDTGTQQSRTVLGWIPKKCPEFDCNSPGFDLQLSLGSIYPSILRYSGIWGAADEAVLNKILKKSKKIPFKISLQKTAQ